VRIFFKIDQQWDSNNIGEYSGWLPKKLSPTVRVILSTIGGTVHHEKLVSRKDDATPVEVRVTALDETTKKVNNS
jgi:hypothetical protein